MDGMILRKFRVSGKRSGAAPVELSLIRKIDKLLAIIFVLSFIACMVALLILSNFGNIGITETAILITAPFFLVGIFVYIQYEKWMYLIVLMVVDAAMYLLKVDLMLIFFASFVLVGAAGVAGVVVLFQRFMFYRIVGIIEYVNVKDKLSIWDKVVVFFFNIPRDLDTRNITMNYNLKRASIPWNEMMQTISLGLMIGTFLWIYMSMNPMFMDAEMLSDVPAVLFTLVLYIPLLVLPWAIFKSLNVRVDTKYRDFTVYDGMKETLKRMSIPFMATFMFVLVAINTVSLNVVLLFIVLSVIFNVVVIGLTSLFFYTMFEAPLVDDVVSRWRIFRPVAISMDIGNDIKTNADVPATPKRDLTEYGALEFPDKR